ncbi:nucleobindin-2-like isoform X1, partial [Dinothrombium tinctorium]
LFDFKLEMCSNRIFLLVLSYLCFALCAPVTNEKHSGNVDNKENEVDANSIEELGLEYHRYLQQVVEHLENDTHFREVLQNASETDVKSGKIAAELEKVDPGLRTKLDEFKRMEIERLNLLVEQEQRLKGSSITRKWRTAHDPDFEKRLNRYEIIIQRNPCSHLVIQRKVAFDFFYQFQTTKDIEKLEQMKRAEFKRYEMEKELYFEESLKNMTEEERKEAIKKRNEVVEEQKHHPRIHHPGSKQQLEEVWKDEDKLPVEEFDPKTFFRLHDLDGNGMWDEMEIEAVLKHELDKIYEKRKAEIVSKSNLSDKEKEEHLKYDENEKEEDMDRMMAEVMKAGDRNEDRHISFDEFLKLTEQPQFEQDKEWKSVVDQPNFNQNEFEEYKKHHDQYQNQFYQYDPRYDPQAYYINQLHAQPHPAYAQQYPPPVYPPNQMNQHIPPPPGYQIHHPDSLPQHPQAFPQYPQYAQHQQGQQFGAPQQMNQHNMGNQPNPALQHQPEHPNAIPLANQHQMPPQQGFPQHPQAAPQNPQHSQNLPQHQGQQFGASQQANQHNLGNQPNPAQQHNPGQPNAIPVANQHQMTPQQGVPSAGDSNH